jgi:hypothetical protein
MRLISRITLFIAVVVIAPTAILAQQKINTIHRPQFVVAAPQPSANVIPQLAGKWDILSTDPDGDSYNSVAGAYLGRIEFTVDFTQTSTALTQVPGHVFTSSACSADGTATVTGTIDPDGNSGNANVQFTATVDQGYTYIFEGNYKKNTPGQISGSWSTSGGACGSRAGSFTAYQYNQLTNKSYSGEFTSDVSGTQVSGVVVNIKEANDFSVSGTLSGPASSCFQGLSIDSTQSYTSGGVVEFFATNSQGAQVAFNASNTDSAYQQLSNDQPNESSLYITYLVYQSGGACHAGDSGHDAVFKLVVAKPVRLPVHLRTRR